jgi:hypothetical protein
MSARKNHKSKLSIIDFQEKFNTEEKCREFLFKLRFPQGFVCPKCGCTEYYFRKKGTHINVNAADIRPL